MEKETLREAQHHGSPEYPLAVYNMNFKGQQLLASLHYHNEFELLVATEGTLCVQIEEKNYYLNAGQGIFINSGLLHTITNGTNLSCGFIAVVFDYSMLCGRQELVFTKYIRPLMNGTLLHEPTLTPSLCKSVEDICKSYAEDIFGSELHIKQNLLSVFHHLVKGSIRLELPAQNTKSTLVKEVLSYMKEHYAEPISLTDMAAHAHVSKEYLCRVFHSLSDSSPVDYLNRYRIGQSTLLLSQTDMSVSDIALACGFNHSSYYGKLFASYIGCTPSEYRRR